jgi:hypothetical protein
VIAADEEADVEEVAAAAVVALAATVEAVAELAVVPEVEGAPPVVEHADAVVRAEERGEERKCLCDCYI